MKTLAVALQWTLPFLIVLSVLEGLAFRWLARNDYAWNENLVSGILGAMDIGSEVLAASVGVGLFQWLWDHRLFTIPVATWWGMLLLFVAVDFAYYWQHRFAHEIRWFWASHMVHHTPTHYNLAMGYRVSWLSKITGIFLFYTPLIWLGFSPGWVFVMLGLNLHYQFWLHSPLIGRLGWLEHLLNTPSHHRVHHASNPLYLDKNYAGVLIFFDKMFGTFVEERDDEPCRYGLVHPIGSNNPLRLSLHEWVAMARDVWNAKTLRGCVGYVFGPPGWRERERGGRDAGQQGTSRNVSASVE
ncbi:sterol desaturase family protein [Paraburkholderia sp. MM5482-R1]|uniref:sterol desaturase family protein n=1 Tax=unclassified Paraburkholderia TaxID=2615204 RepID=UPI003D1CC9D5